MPLHFIVDKLTGRAEVDQHNLVVGCDNHIVGLDVAVQDVQTMDIRNRIGDLGNIVDGIGVRKPAPSFHYCLKTASFHKRHHHIGCVVFVKDVNHLDNLGVVQLGERLGLFHEPLAVFLENILCNVLQAYRQIHRVANTTTRRKEFLDADWSVKAHLNRPVGLAETTFPDFLFDDVLAVEQSRLRTQISSKIPVHVSS